MKNKPNFNRNVIISSILAAAAPSTFAVDGLTLKTQADLNRRIQIEYNVRQAAAALITEFQTDVDGYPLPPQMEPVGIVAPGVSAIPAASSAPRTDSMGLELAYCAWNNGTSNTGLPNYLDGIPNNINASTIAVIHRGLDGMFQTTCADLGPAPGNLGVGDDVVVVQSASEVYKGIGGTFFYGDPVNTEAELSCAVDGGLIDCEALPERSMRFVNETGRMYQVLRDPADNEKRFFDISGGWGTGYGNPASLTDGFAYTQNRTVIGANSAPAGITDQLYVQGNNVDPAISVAGNNKSLAFRAADGTRYASAGLNALGDFEISSDLVGQDLVIGLPPSGDPLNPSASMRMDETGTTFSAPVFIDELFTNQVITEDLAVQGNTILGDNAAEDSLQVNAASEFRGPVTITSPNVLNAQGGIETPIINASGQVLDIRAATTRVSGDLEVLGQSTLNGLLTANGGILTTTINADDISTNTIYSMIGVFGNVPNLRAGTVLTANGDAAFEGRTSFFSPTGAFSEVNGSTIRQSNTDGTRLSQLNPESGLAFVNNPLGGPLTNSRIFYDPARGLVFTNNTGLPYIFENGGLDVAGNSVFRNDLQVLGNTSLAGDLSVDGISTFNNQLIANTGLVANGPSTFNDTLTANGVFEANNTANFNGLVNFNQPIAVNNTSTFGGLATFNGGIQTTFINTTGNANIGGNLTVTGTTNLNGPTSVNNTFQTNGNTIIGNNPSDSLIVNATTEFNGPVTFNDQVDFVNGLKTYPLIIEQGARQSILQFDAANNFTFTSNAGVTGSYLFDRNVTLTPGRSFTTTGTSTTGNPQFMALNSAGLVLTENGNNNNLQMYINDSNLSGQLNVTTGEMQFRLTQPASPTVDAAPTQNSRFYFNDKIVIKEGVSAFGSGSPQSLLIEGSSGNKASLSSNGLIVTGNTVNGSLVGTSASVIRAADGSSANFQISNPTEGIFASVANTGIFFLPEGSIARPGVSAGLLPSTISQNVGGVTTEIGQPTLTLRTDRFSGAPAGTTSIRGEASPQYMFVAAVDGAGTKFINTEINLAGFEALNTTINRRSTLTPQFLLLNGSSGNQGAGGVAFSNFEANQFAVTSSNNLVTGREFIEANATDNTNATLVVRNAARRTTISKGGLRIDTLLTGDNVQFFLDQNTQNPSFTTTGTRYNFDRPIFINGNEVLTTGSGPIAPGDGAGGAAPNSVEMGVDTFGDYVQSISGTNGIVVTGGTGEASTPSVSLEFTGVTPRFYGSSSLIPLLEIDSYGRVIAATEVPIGAATQVQLASDLSTNADRFITFSAARTGAQQLLTDLGFVYNPGTNTLSATNFAGAGSALTNLNATNIATGTLNAARLPTSGVVAGTYGSAAQVPVLTIDAFGRITNAATQAVATGSSVGIQLNGALNAEIYPMLTDQTTGNESTAIIDTDYRYNPSLNRLTVGSIVANGSGLTNLAAGNIASGTLNAARLPLSGVAAGTFGSATQVGQFTVDQFGRITNAQNVAISTPAGGFAISRQDALNANIYPVLTDQTTGTEGQGIIDLAYFYNPATNLLTAGAFSGSGAALTALNASNIASGTLNAARLPTSGVTAGTYGSGSQVPVLTVDAFGRITSATTQTVVAGTSGLTITQENVNATRYLTFTDQLSGSETSGLIDTSLTYNPSTNLLAAGAFSGSGAALTSLNASNIASGTLSTARLPTSGVVAGTYGTATEIPRITIDAFGRITNATTQNVPSGGLTIVSENTNATRFLTFTDQTTGIENTGLIDTTLTYNPSTKILNAFSFSGRGDGLTNLNASRIATGTLSADRLPLSGVTAGTYGSGSQVPVLTIDAFGRITSATTQAVTGGGSLSTVNFETADQAMGTTTYFPTFATSGDGPKTLQTTGDIFWQPDNNRFIIQDPTQTPNIFATYGWSGSTVATVDGGLGIRYSNVGLSSGEVLTVTNNTTNAIRAQSTKLLSVSGNAILENTTRFSQLSPNRVLRNYRDANSNQLFIYDGVASAEVASLTGINATSRFSNFVTEDGANVVQAGFGNFQSFVFGYGANTAENGNVYSTIASISRAGDLAVQGTIRASNIPLLASAPTSDFVVTTDASGNFRRTQVSNFLAQAGAGTTGAAVPTTGGSRRYVTSTLGVNGTSRETNEGFVYIPSVNELQFINPLNDVTYTDAVDGAFYRQGVTIRQDDNTATATPFIRMSTQGSNYTQGLLIDPNFIQLRDVNNGGSAAYGYANAIETGLDATTAIPYFRAIGLAGQTNGEYSEAYIDNDEFTISNTNTAGNTLRAVRLIIDENNNNGRFEGAALTNLVFAQSTTFNGPLATRMRLEWATGNLFITGSLSQNSDIRLKQNIQRLDSKSTLEKLKLLSGYTYQFRENPSITQYGLIAQEIQGQFPEMVQMTENGTLAVSYTMMVPTLLEGVKEVDSKLGVISTKISEYDAKFKEVDDSISLVNTKLTEITDQLLAQTTGLDQLSEEVTGIKAQTADLTERIVKLEGRETLADLFTKNEETQMVQVNFNGLQAKNLKAERIEANKAYFTELEAERAKIAEIEAQKIKAGQIGTDEKVLVANFGVANDVFTAAPGATYMVTAMGEDGSFATVSVLNNNGVLIVNKMAGEGIDVMANGQNFSISGIGQKVKVSWLRTS